MSTLNEMLRQVEQKDAQLAADLRRGAKALESRRAFGLNFERHVPETVELLGRPARRGDKVWFVPKRGELAGGIGAKSLIVRGKDNAESLQSCIHRGALHEPCAGERRFNLNDLYAQERRYRLSHGRQRNRSLVAHVQIQDIRSIDATG